MFSDGLMPVGFTYYFTDIMVSYCNLSVREATLDYMGKVFMARQCGLMIHHYSHATMSAVVSQTHASRLFTQRFIRAQIKENIKAPRHWPLCEEFTGERWIPHTKGQ